MSSTSTSVAAALPTQKSKITGHIFAIVGGVLAIISFFLPWVAYVVNGAAFLTLTGLEGAAGPAIQTGTGADLFRSSALAFIVPIAGVVALMLVLLAFRRGYVTVWDAFGLMVLGLIPLIVVWLRFGDAQELAESAGAELQAQIGLQGAILALIALMVAGALDMRPATERSPGLRGTLGAWGFMLPAGALVIIFFFIPVIILFILSLTDLASSNFGKPWNFIGLGKFHPHVQRPILSQDPGQHLHLCRPHLGLLQCGTGAGVGHTDYSCQPPRRFFLSRALVAATPHTLGDLYSDVAAYYCPRSIRYPQPTVGPVWRGVAPMDLHQSLAFCHFGEWLCRRLFWADIIRLGNRIYSQGLCHSGQSRWRLRVADYP